MYQGMVQKSQALFQRSQRLIDLSARKYSDAQAALVQIVGEQNVGWKKLQLSDICMLDDCDMAVDMSRKKLGKKSRAEMRAQAAEKEQAENIWVGMHACQKELEHMWKGLGEDGRWRRANRPGGVRGRYPSEGCKAHAQAEQWREEVILVEEEMQRCLVMLEVKAKEWEHRADYDGPLLLRVWKMMDEPGESEDAITNDQDNYDNDGDKQEEQEEQEQEEQDSIAGYI
ncbi:hypothetical protein BT96DRAFT_945434 [Gymnopus androsaceus JB14]|uniref:Uncharacterized protein n=1 Tax=Gymnopus androsaceus JB14 TaxID=1447944 RepID=A0A6A4GZI5_9AGAR|nr:hypothetical protein BT96DRAFT_945434 [Gymnopus androsaceus JB14]